MRVGFVQFDCKFGAVPQNVERAATLVSAKKADLWVLPELFNTGYKFTSKREVISLAEPIPSGPTTQKLVQLAKNLKVSIVAGLVEQENSEFYNACIFIGPQGYVGTYRKIHLFSEEKRWFTPGNFPFNTYDIVYKSSKDKNLKASIGMMICFDWIFPESAGTLTRLGADIICHPSNLVLPHCPNAMMTRCLENRIFAITANRIGTETRGEGALRYIGCSQVVDPSGEILSRASSEEEVAHVVTIDPGRARNKSINPYNHLINDRAEDFYL